MPRSMSVPGSLSVHRAVRADLLAEGLADLLATPLPDPFASELVIVPARGVERWLSQRLSHRLGPTPGRDDGVCAAVEFRSPASLVAELSGTRDQVDPWSPDALVWPMLEVIDRSASQSWCRPLAEHLGYLMPDGEEAELRRGRRYAVARRLARLFASYAVQRPTLLADWEAGRNTDGAGADLDEDLLWQAELWRCLVAHLAIPTPGQRHADVCERLADAPVDGLPERISLFGHTRLPATEVQLLRALATHHDVHLWLPHPSPELWNALQDRASGAVRRFEDDSHESAAHPLLASLGRDVRELQRTLGPVEGEVIATPTEADTLLHQLQADIAANALPDRPRPLAEDDRSISVHACHGAARQVEVLREVLVGLLADDPSLQPRDILVMCPDIEAYAPLIAAAFGLGEVTPEGQGHPGQYLRVRMADRALTPTNPLLAVALRLLDIAAGRAEASVVLDLLAMPPVRRRFGFSDDDLARIDRWAGESGIRWAFTAHERAPYGLEKYLQNTWRFGLDRLLAGVAVGEDASRWFGTTLPLDDVASNDINVVGPLAEAIDRLQHACARMTGGHPVGHWLDVLGEAIESLTECAFGEEWQLGQVQRELAAIGSAADADTVLRLPDLRALLEERFAGRPTRANFRTGTLTVCTMVPMRSVPHRVIALLGVDDGVFPRAGVVDGDDVLARGPLTGERDLRGEDRQLLLDAVMAAREHLVITYTGASEATGQPRPCAVPVQELLDALDQTAVDAGSKVVHRHPLQAFAVQSFAPEAPFSFDVAAEAGARAAAGPRTPPPALRDVRLDPPSGDVELADLAAFLKNPVGCFLRRRLEVAVPAETDEILDAMPVEVSGLDGWGVGERMLRDLIAGASPEDARNREWRRGKLPPGQLGWRTSADILAKAQAVAESVSTATGGLAPSAREIDVELPNGRRVFGAVTDLYDRRVVKSSYSRLGPKHWLDAWVAGLALQAAFPGRGYTAGAVGRGQSGAMRVAFQPAEDPRALLAELIDLYDAGMSGPLPLPVKTAHAWATAHPRARYWKAKDCWDNRKWPGENAEPAHQMVWGPKSGIDVLLAEAPRPGEEYAEQEHRLGALAIRLWRPILDHGSEQRG